MNTEKLNQIIALRKLANGLATFWENYTKRTEESQVDKYHARFGFDDRFVIFRFSGFFSACTGLYGNSGCSIFANGINHEKAGKYITQAINVHKREIFETAAKLAENDLQEFVDDAQFELDSIQQVINQTREKCHNK